MNRLTFLPITGAVLVRKAALLVLAGLAVSAPSTVLATTIISGDKGKPEVLKDKADEKGQVTAKRGGTAQEQAQRLSNRGLINFHAGKVGESLLDFNKALTIDPTFVQGLINRGAAHMKLGQVDRAIADYERAILLDNKSAEAVHSLGMAMEIKGAPDAALRSYSKAIELKPSFEPAWSKRARLRSKQREFTGAISDYTQVILINPSNALAYHNRGVCYQEIGKKPEATADIQKAAELERAAAQKK